MLHRMTIKVIHVYQLETLYYLCYWVKCQPWIIWGHRGQKVIFTKKASSPREYVPLTCDLCICINLTPSTKVITLNKIIRDRLESQIIFTKKCYKSSMLYSMTMKLIHVHKLETLYLYNGVRSQTGVIWGHRGQKVIFTKNALTRPCYIEWP